MQKNKIIVEKGHTTIIDNKSSKEPNIKRANSDLLSEMQSVFDKVEKGSQSVSTMGFQNEQNTPSNANFCGNCNQTSIMSLLPLLAGINGKNMGNISSIMNSLPSGQNGGGNMNLISGLFPLLQNLKSSSKKIATSDIKIDSLTKADG